MVLTLLVVPFSSAHVAVTQALPQPIPPPWGSPRLVRFNVNGSSGHFLVAPAASYPGLLIWKMSLQQIILPCCRWLALCSIHLIMVPSSKQGLERSVKDFWATGCDPAERILGSAQSWPCAFFVCTKFLKRCLWTSGLELSKPEPDCHASSRIYQMTWKSNLILKEFTSMLIETFLPERG